MGLRPTDIEKIMEIPEDPTKIEQQRTVFRRTLERYVPESGYRSAGSARILNLGCGRSYEARPLNQYFGDGTDSRKVIVVGIDKNEEQIERSRVLYRGLSQYVFIRGDIARQPELIDGEFDVIVARHHTAIAAPDEWNQIFRESKKVLKPEGILIATSFQDIEHTAIRTQAEKVGYRVILDCKNECSIPITKHVGLDRNILIARH